MDSEASKVVDLQESSESQDTGQTSTGHDDLGGASGGRRGGGRLSRRSGRTSRGSGGSSGEGDDGAVLGRGQHGGSGRSRGSLRNAGVADHRAGGGDRLGDSARAVGDGEGSSLSHGVGAATVGDLGRSRAVGDVGLDDLSNDGDVAGGGEGRGASGSSEDDGSGELHLVGIKGNSEELIIRYIDEVVGLTNEID